VVPKLKEHVDKTGVGRYEIALIYAALQENDKAFRVARKCRSGARQGPHPPESWPLPRSPASIPCAPSSVLPLWSGALAFPLV